MAESGAESELSQTTDKKKAIKVQVSKAQAKQDQRINEVLESRLEDILHRFESKLATKLDQFEDNLDRKFNDLASGLETRILQKVDVATDQKLQPIVSKLSKQTSAVETNVVEIQSATNKNAQDIAELQADVQTLKGAVGTNPANVPSHDRFPDDVITELKAKISSLEARCDEQARMIVDNSKDLSSEIERVELHSRKLNLVFEGVVQRKDEDCKQIVTDIICQTMGLDMEDPIDVAHRKYYVGKPNANKPPVPIVARCRTLEDKIRVLDNGKKLKDTGLYVSKDYPQSYNERRSTLFRHLKSAKAVDDNARVVRDCLIFRKEKYSVENIHLADFSEPNHTVVTDTQVRFYGRHSKLSNFFPSKFELRGIKYSCVEEAIMYGRACRHYKYGAAVRIRQQTNPVAMKRIGNPLRPTTEEGRQAELELIKDALTAKFTQNPGLKATLLETGNRELLECNPYDSYYGTGLRATDAKLDTASFDGTNIMGKLLMEVRRSIAD